MITIAVGVAAGALLLAHVSREGRDQAAMEDASRSLAGLSDDRLAQARQRCINAIGVERLSLIHISEPTRHICLSRMPSSA